MSNRKKRAAYSWAIGGDRENFMGNKLGWWVVYYAGVSERSVVG